MTTRFAVIACPGLDEADSARIEAFRRAHDPQYDLVRAHLTLVFPSESRVEQLVRRAKDCASDRSPFKVVFPGAVPHEDPGSPTGWVFLVPDEGAREVVLLHRALDPGEPGQDPRTGSVFVPHVTIARARDRAAAAALASAWNEGNAPIEGSVDAVLVVAIDGRTLTIVERVPLARPNER